MRRRRLLRGRRAALAVAGVFAVTAGGALAAPGDTDTLPPTTVKAAQRALDVKADGVVGPKTKRAIRRYQRAKGLAVDGQLGPSTLESLGVSDDGDASAQATGPPAQANADSNGGQQASEETKGAADTQAPADAPPPPTSSQAATLERIAECESGGDPTAVSATGQYRGKYQFDRETWQRMGGSGDPAAAPEGEQDARAAQLLARRGTAPWPACG